MDQNGTRAAVGISVFVIPMMTVGNVIIGFVIGLILFYLIRWGASKSEVFCKEVNVEAKRLYQQIAKKDHPKID